jgi:hypothetical protein
MGPREDRCSYLGKLWERKILPAVAGGKSHCGLDCCVVRLTGAWRDETDDRGQGDITYTHTKAKNKWVWRHSFLNGAWQDNITVAGLRKLIIESTRGKRSRSALRVGWLLEVANVN